MRSAALVFSVFVGLFFAAPQSPINLIVNGGFEEAAINPPNYQDLPAGSTAIRGWTVTLKHIDYVNAALWLPSEGKHSLDLEGSACNVRMTTDCLGGVKQTFATIVGQKYDVAFDLAGNPYAGPPVKTIKVSAAGKSQEFTFSLTGHNARSMGWKTEHWSFTATEAATTLEFDSADNTPGISGWGPALDNVVVTRQ